MTIGPPYRLRLTSNARQDLARELRRSRAKWGRPHQQHFEHGLRDFLVTLASAPHAYRSRPESFGVRVAYYKTVRTVYLVDEDRRQVEIIAFVWRREIETILHRLSEAGPTDPTKRDESD